VDTIESVAGTEAREEKHQEDKKKENNNNAFSLELATTTATDPWMLFLYALKAPATKDKYIDCANREATSLLRSSVLK
jgi:hypothetical protein